MSLMASANRRIKEKGKKNVLASRGSNANGHGNSNDGFFKQQQQQQQHPISPYDMDSGNGNRSSPVATVNKSQYNVGGSPNRSMPQSNSQYHQPQQHMSQPQQAYHSQQPQMMNSNNTRRGYVGGGMNDDQWQQQTAPPSPQPQYLHPQQQHIQHPPSPRSSYQPYQAGREGNDPSTFDSATRYQGSYTNYLSPRHPGRVPSKPRRRYDSFTDVPPEEEQQQMNGKVQQEQQAFDPFAPSPVNVPHNQHNARTASPAYFQKGDNFLSSQPHQMNVDHPQSHMVDNSDNFVYDNTQAANNNEDDLVAQQPVLGAADFEYHTEKDEDTFDNSNRDQDTSFESSTLIGQDIVQPLNNNSGRVSNLAVNDMANMTENDNQTVNSEQALQGTPVKKKHSSPGDIVLKPKSGKSKKNKSKVIIDNVDENLVHPLSDNNNHPDQSLSSDAARANNIPNINRVGSGEGNNNRRNNARYAIHSNNEDGDETTDDEDVVKNNNNRLATHKMRDIAAHARRFASTTVSSEGSETSGGDLPPAMPSSTTKTSPQRIGNSKSWDSKEGMNKNKFDWAQGAKEWDNVEEEGGKQPKYSKARESKSWDDDIVPRTGTWGDQNSSLFDGTSTQANSAMSSSVGLNAFGEGMIGGGGSSDKENGNSTTSTNARALAEWDRAEAEWRGNVSVGDEDKQTKQMPSLMAGAATKNHPWKSNNLSFEEFEPESSVFGSVGGKEVDIRQSESASALTGGDDETDDDSIFGGVTASSRGGASSDIFNQIEDNIKQADKSKSRALGIHPIGSDDRSEAEISAQRARDMQALLKQVNSSHSEASASAFEDEKKKRKSISFGEANNTVHTYVAAAESSESNDGTKYTTDDDDAIPLSEKIGRSEKANAKSNQRPQSMFPNYHNDDDDDDNDESTIQEGSINTYDDSTLGDSVTYKSGMSHDDDEEEQKEEDGDELNLLDQVGFGMGALAASLGGLFDVGPEDVPTESNSESNKNVNNNKNAGTKVGATENDNLNEIPLYDGESTAISTTNRTSGHSTGTGNTSGQSGQSSENDWLGYLGNMIFPKGSASIPSGAESTIFSGDTTTYDQESTFQEDEDSYLLQQALAAARAIHHVQGVEYDETQEINVLSDIKFVVVTVSLPLGCKCFLYCVCV